MIRFETIEETATSEEWEPRGETVLAVNFAGSQGHPVVVVEGRDSDGGWAKLRHFERGQVEPLMLFPAVSLMRLRVQSNTGGQRITFKTYD